MQVPSSDSALQAPLLDPFEAVVQQAFPGNYAITWRESCLRMTKDFYLQLAIAGPLAVNLVIANALAVANLYFVARGGTMQLAAAALGNNVAVMLGRLVLLGLCGALDTLAAQAWGAGKEKRLPLLLQRTVLFLWLHCVVISAAMLMLPAGLQAIGQDPGLSAMVRRYLLALLPSVWLEALSRPITRVLVARGIVNPQMVISLIGLPLNVATNYALVVMAGWEYMGAAVAMSAAAGYDVIMLLLYVAASGQWLDVIGSPTRKALKGWRQLVRLAYPAASMKCAESWAFTICTLAASLLPNACSATAAVGLSYNVYGVLFIAFVACSTAACVSVGNRLGAGDPRGAQLAAAGSLLIVPPAWGAAAIALLVPRCQDAIMSLFVTGDESSSGDDASLLRGVLRHMFVIVAGLVLMDGIQTVLSGIIQGCGRQQAGALVNLVAFYVFALPLALLLAFRRELPPRLGGGVLGLGLGPEGLYLGMSAGPAIQMVSYTYILLRTNWQRVSQAAVSAAALKSTSSLASLLWRMDSGGLAGPQLVRSAPSSGHGMGSLSGMAPLRLPIIEEHWREGRDSSDSFGNPAAAAISASASASALASALASVSASVGVSSWLQTNCALLAAAMTGSAGAEVEVDAATMVFMSSSLGGGATMSDSEDDITLGARDGAGVASPSGVTRSVLPSRQTSFSSRLRTSSVTATTATAPISLSDMLAVEETHPGQCQRAAAVAPCGRAGDVSPATEAHLSALITAPGSPPVTDHALNCMLAPTLNQISPATTCPCALLPVVYEGPCCQSLPRGVQLHAHALGAPVPLAAAPAKAAFGNGGGATVGVAARPTTLAAAVRWVLGWGGAPASSEDATVEVKDVTETPVVDADAVDVPLQPGVVSATEPFASGMDFILTRGSNG